MRMARITFSRLLACLAAVLLLAAAADVFAEAETQRFYGYAYDAKSGRYLYTEVYEVRVDAGRWLSGTTRYLAPDGTSMGERKFSFAQDRTIPIYSLELVADGYREGITSFDADGIEAYKASRDKGRQTATLARVSPMVADCGSQAFLVDHFDALAAGKTVAFTLAVAGQLDSYKFLAKKDGEVEFEGKRALRIRVEPDSMLRFLVSPLALTYDPETKRLLEYVGVANVHDPATHKAYTARIAFYSKRPDDAPKNLPPLP